MALKVFPNSLNSELLEQFQDCKSLRPETGRKELRFSFDQGFYKQKLRGTLSALSAPSWHPGLGDTCLPSLLLGGVCLPCLLLKRRQHVARSCGQMCSVAHEVLISRKLLLIRITKKLMLLYSISWQLPCLSTGNGQKCPKPITTRQIGTELVGFYSQFEHTNTHKKKNNNSLVWIEV